MVKKRGAGAPTKEEARKNKIRRMKEKYSGDSLKVEQLLVDNYYKYVDLLNEVANGKKGFSSTNQISCAKILKEETEKLFGAAEEEGAVETTEEKTQPVAQLISLTAKEA